MPYFALEWDHRIGKPMISWIVVECVAVVQKCGGPQALPPRRDVVYFVKSDTAAQDARLFADFKNRMHGLSTSEVLADPLVRSALEGGPRHRHAAFAWDHNIFNALIRWAVLEWSGDPNKTGPREDVAYFLDPETAEMDARVFSLMRDQWLQELLPLHRVAPS